MNSLALLALLVSSSPAPAPAPVAVAAPATEPLAVDCPDAVSKVFCGMSTDPAANGEPVPSGGCPPYTITYSDVSITPQNCEAGRFVESIRRTFTVTDTCGGSVECVQDIHVLKQLVSLDLHPRSCPNPMNRNANGVYPSAILGSASFDVTTIVPGSVRLWLFNCAAGPAIPIQTMFQYSDVAAPYTGGVECACTTAGPDGFVDLTFKMNRQEMIQALNLSSFPSMSYVKIFVTGDLTNGCEFIGSDCVRVQN